MRTLSNELKQNILDLSAEGLFRLPLEIIEKDIHVTDALQAIANTSVKTEFNLSQQEKGDPRPKKIQLGSTLVFAGGTCLSKAHRLIARMSEDIDVKVYLEPVPEGYVRKNGGSNRKRLTELHEAIESNLTSLGFVSTPIESLHEDGDDSDEAAQETPVQGKKNPHIRDDRRYFHLSLDYKSVFQKHPTALRPQIKVELIHRHTILPTTPLTMGYLLDELAGRAPTTAVTMQCISVEETVAEKVLSMLRRCAWKWYGGQRANLDVALVRHVYDVGQIIQQRPEVLSAAMEIFPRLVAKDANEFGRQYPEFVDNAAEILMKALRQIATEEELKQQYAQRLVPLTYAEEPPPYEDAYAVFAALAEQFIATLSTAKRTTGS